ncbi:hypothetical protein Q3G72_013559 [Acer saccharum]|nr:hypothetical protein Q3G72_013559 [Acer saccharum]
MSADQTTWRSDLHRGCTVERSAPWRSDLHCTEERSAPELAHELHLTPINAGGGFSGKFSKKAMGINDVRVDVKLNKHIWSRGIRSVPRRVRVRIARKRNDDEDAKEELYSLVTVTEIPAEGLRGLGTKVIEDED